MTPGLLVDTHVHLNHYHHEEEHAHADQCEALFETMEKEGVDHAVVITSYTESCDRPAIKAILDDLELDDEVRECVAWRTAARLFDIDVAALGRR